jgi:hypothetical protein
MAEPKEFGVKPGKKNGTLIFDHLRTVRFGNDALQTGTYKEVSH